MLGATWNHLGATPEHTQTTLGGLTGTWEAIFGHFDLILGQKWPFLPKGGPLTILRSRRPPAGCSDSFIP